MQKTKTNENRSTKGKKENQKLKTYILLQYFLKNTDERHPAQMQDILQYLNEDCGIAAERRSIYRDIADINKVLYMLENDCSIQEAEEAMEDEGERYIVSNNNRSGYYLCRRPYGIEPDDVRLLAECVYNARFINEDKAEELMEIVGGLVSQWDAEDIRHDAFVVDRVKTDNKTVLNNVSTINYAMRRGTAADPHTPEKISFNYQKRSIDDVTQTIDRRKGAAYKVSPFRLLINEGNYYLLAFDDKSQEMRTYRVDRMRGVRAIGEPRDAEDEFRLIAKDFENYTQRVFGMFGGKRVRVTLRFINPLLDTVVDRFGTKGLHYTKADDSHFTVDPEVEISDQFFSWLCGFGKKVRIIGPEFVREEFMAYLDKIRQMY